MTSLWRHPLDLIMTSPKCTKLGVIWIHCDPYLYPPEPTATEAPGSPDHRSASCPEAQPAPTRWSVQKYCPPTAGAILCNPLPAPRPTSRRLSGRPTLPPPATRLSPERLNTHGQSAIPPSLSGNVNGEKPGGGGKLEPRADGTSAISSSTGATLFSPTTTGKISGGESGSGAALISPTTTGKISGGNSASGEHNCKSASPSMVTSSANDTWRRLGGHKWGAPPGKHSAGTWPGGAPDDGIDLLRRG